MHNSTPKSPSKMSKKLHSNTGFDRISSLPDPIKAHILSYLPTIAAIKTCILSNTWRALWTQITSLDFSRNKFPNSLNFSYLYANYAFNSPKVTKETIARKRESFYEFLDRAFESILMLEKLQLYVPEIVSELKCRIDNWVVRGFGFPLVEFKFEVGYDSSEKIRYCLPNCVFNSSLITKLSLVNCEVGSSSLTGIHLPVLCILRLVSVYITDEAMSSLVANSPSLESLVFKTCDGLVELEISGLSKLKTAEIKYVYEKPLAIFIEAPSLVDFTYECANLLDNDGYCELELINCLNLKRFVTIGTALDDYDLHSLLGKLPSLERLELRHCDCFRNIQISSPNIVDFTFIHCGWVRKVELNTPNLKAFHYKEEYLVSLPLRGPTPRLKEATIYLKPDVDDKYYARLVPFFAKLRHCERLTLSVRSEKDLMVPPKVRMKTRPPLSGVKHIAVEVRVSFKKCTLESFLEGLLWLAPCPETIEISNRHIPVYKSLKLEYEKPSKYQKKCGCWKSLPINCWRHSLTKLSIENLRGGEDDTNLANFFRNSRIDGMTVDCLYKTSVPRATTKE